MDNQLSTPQEICSYKQDSCTYCCQVCKLEFINGSELDEHISVHHSMGMDLKQTIDAEPTELQNLDINCIETIFKFLPLNDLAAFSLTCKTYKKWAEEYFDRHIESGTVYIWALDRLNFQQCEKYEIRFRSFIRSISVEILNSTLIIETLNFIKGNCSRRLQSLQWNCFLNEWHLIDHIEIIADQIKNLKKLAIDCDLCGSIILRQCQNLQVLVISGDFNTRKFSLADHDEEEDMTTFFHRNPQLKLVYADDNTVIQSFCQSEINLPYAVFKFESERDFFRVQNDLEKSCARNYIKTLDLSFKFGLKEQISRTISNFENVKSLHFIHFEDESFNGMSIQSNLERLCFTIFGAFKKSFADKVVEFFPNLRELHIMGLQGYEGDSFKDVVMPIIYKLRQMRDFYFNVNNKFRFDEDDLIGLNDARSKEGDATIVTIHIDCNLEKSDKKFVKIKADSSVQCFMCIGYNTSHNCKYVDRVLAIKST